ncbi:MAG: hypothetical protein ACI7YS_05015 [Flavobacterium sp.]
MKTILSYLIFGFSLLSFSDGLAQYNNYYRPSGMMDRSIGTNQYKRDKKKPINQSTNLLDESLNYLEKELTLDTFQKTIVKDLLEKNQIEETKVLNKSIPDDSKIEEIGVLRNRLDTNIQKILSDDQSDKFKKMKSKLERQRNS